MNPDTLFLSKYNLVSMQSLTAQSELFLIHCEHVGWCWMSQSLLMAFYFGIAAHVLLLTATWIFQPLKVNSSSLGELFWPSLSVVWCWSLPATAYQQSRTSSQSCPKLKVLWSKMLLGSETSEATSRRNSKPWWRWSIGSGGAPKMGSRSVGGVAYQSWMPFFKNHYIISIKIYGVERKRSQSKSALWKEAKFNQTLCFALVWFLFFSLPRLASSCCLITLSIFRSLSLFI